MIVQQAPNATSYTDYAQRALTAITDMQKKVNEIYLNKDAVNGRSLIFSDYTVNIANPMTPGLTVSFTYNTLAGQRVNNLTYTNIFIRNVVAANQDVWTLSSDSFKSVQGLLKAPIGGNGYLHFQQTDPTGPILSNVDFIAEQKFAYTNPASVTPEILGTAIQNLVTNAGPVQQSLNQILAAPRDPMPPYSNSKLTVSSGLMPIDNFAVLGKVAYARIGEWKTIQSNYPADYPVSYGIGVYNDTVGSAPACYIQYAGNQPTMRVSFLCTMDFGFNDWFTLPWLVNDFSIYLNSDSEIKPANGGHYVLYFDSSRTDLPNMYGNAAYNPVAITNAADLGSAAKEFYLSTI